MDDTRDYDALKHSVMHASCEERLHIIRQEMVSPVITARILASRLEALDISHVQGLPENFTEILDILIRNTKVTYRLFSTMADVIESSSEHQE
jgi:hypothetical protein